MSACMRYIRQVVQHAWRARRAADCLRFASPAEATWRLEAWRLGGWELGSLEDQLHDDEDDMMI